MLVSLIMLVDYPQSLTNADILGQGNLDLVREKSGNCQGILLSIICGNPVYAFPHKRYLSQQFSSYVGMGLPGLNQY